ncbi:MAG: RIP metalloprotease RseP [Thermodesulfobacteriota bacterium]
MTYVIATIIVLGLLIFVHELGHFLVAKILGVRVERFSLGFPPKMVGKRIGETEYMISWIPLGGYVKMFGEHPDETEEVPPEERHRSFSHKPAWARFLIVLAGPFFNLLFTFLVLWAILLATGLEKYSTTIGLVTPGGPAAESGIQAGDTVLAVDGQAVTEFSQIRSLVLGAQGHPLVFSMERGGRTFSVELSPRKTQYENIYGEVQEEYLVGISPYRSAVVGLVERDSPAFKAGIKEGDQVVAIGGEPVGSWYDVDDRVLGAGDAPLEFTLLRQGARITLTLTPRIELIPNAKGGFDPRPEIGMFHQVERESIGPFTALYWAWSKTLYFTEVTFTSIVKLFERKVSIKTLGGPIFIAELAGRKAKAGFLELIHLAAFISLNLGFLNLLPIPVLDGGHLFFFALEGVFRRPISIRVRERAQQVGIVILLSLMVLIFYNDIARLVQRWSISSPDTAVEETRPVQPR